MTLFSSVPHRLPGALGLTLAFMFFASLSAYAAELEGTEVPLDAPHTAPVATDTQTSAPDAPAAPAAPPADEPPSSEEQTHLVPAPAGERKENPHRNWEHDWEKNLSQAFGGSNDGGNNSRLALLIVLFVVFFIFGSPIILLILILFFFFGAKRRRQRDINMNIDKLLAAGRDIPVELLRGDDPKGPEESGNLNKGIRNIFLGAGWLVFLTILFSIEIGATGFIWIALGASQVLIWYLNKPNGVVQAGQPD